MVYGLNYPEKSEAVRRLAELYDQPGPLEPADIRMVLNILGELGAREYADQVAEGYYLLAVQSLDGLGLENQATDTLRELAASLLQRKA